MREPTHEAGGRSSLGRFFWAVPCGRPAAGSVRVCEPPGGTGVSGETLSWGPVPEIEQDVPSGTIFEGKYRIERPLGRGGMGQVYEATHLLLDKAVAIKVLLPEYAADQEMVGRVTREARAASAMGHRNIAAVTDMGWTGDRPFIVMELLVGETLDALLRREGTVDFTRATAWMIQVLDALEAVHAKRIIHRDLKPANVMLVDGLDPRDSVKILDFGIAKASAEVGSTSAQSRTKTGRIMGTPNHMAPEQARATGDIDHRVDLHAAGSLYYTMLCGEPPFRGPNVTATLARLLEGEFAPPSQRVGGVPAAVDAVLRRALAVDREDRFPDAATMRRELERLATGDGPRQSAEVGPPGVEVGARAPRFERVPGVSELVPMPTGPAVTAVAVSPGGDTTRPSALDAPLQLDVPAQWKPGQSERSPLQAPRSGPGFNWGWLVMVVVLLAVAGGVWTYWGELTGGGAPSEGRHRSGERILLLVDTVPKSAIVFVDDVQRDERPIELVASDEHIKLRVEAPGYAPRVMQVQPSTTRRIRIELDKAR